MPEGIHSSAKLNDVTHATQSDSLTHLSRSPHPYHRPNLHVHRAPIGACSPAIHSPLRSRQNTDDEDFVDRQSSYSRDSDSGTEADDEHFLRGLPAPRPRQHKGFRGTSDGYYSNTPSPLLSPAILGDENRTVNWQQKRAAEAVRPLDEEQIRNATEKFRRKRWAELKRRILEVLLLAIVGMIVVSSNDVRLALSYWKNELACQVFVIAFLVTLYPLRIMYGWMVDTISTDTAQRWPWFFIPAYFEPAPVLYPPILTMLVASLLSVSSSAVLLPNIILSIASLPPALIPTLAGGQDIQILHWFLCSIPLFRSDFANAWLNPRTGIYSASGPDGQTLNPEILVLLCPLHQALCIILQYLTTTSLLTAESQLLSIALINILLLSSSPQSLILKALLWGGGVATIVMCGKVLSWGVSLARVPKWRFRRAGNLSKRKMPSSSQPASMVPYFSWLQQMLSVKFKSHYYESDDEDSIPKSSIAKPSKLRLDISNMNGHAVNRAREDPISAIEQRSRDRLTTQGTAHQDFEQPANLQRRHTLPNSNHQPSRSAKRTPSGRRKRSASSSVQSFFSLTERQATTRKWLYAVYVYACVLLIILVGVREYVGKYALDGNEPLGWALGYLLGGQQWFRMQVVSANMERWICLPELHLLRDTESCHSGWVEHLRQATFTPANTRLILFAYWLAIIIVGLAVVFRLSAIYEVDTRRKVFHFMMVGMLLPATYIDPTFAALALILVLAVFLLLDLFRASQLPPLSQPLAYFLTPYVDGRDLRGPVVVSHIFLLIGCAIPLWLSLGTLPRSGNGYAAGWEIPTREVSMVSGVICVGLGDAAASLIGRRYGRHKWFWSGGKSIEGSIAFATAVSLALLLARAWLVIGGWPTINNDPWGTTVWKVGVAAGTASLTEAVLTGGNDNVVVPVILWLCVKGLGI